MTLAASGATLSATTASAQAVDEKDPTAVALGYVADSTKADGKKFPKHDNTQRCDGCALWMAKAGEAQGNCALFAGKKVEAKGWCSAWSKKA
jgi:hypothetical protein